MTSSRTLNDDRPVLSAASADALRSALRLHIQKPDGGADSQVTSALAIICDEARRDQIPPERLLVAFKAILSSLPEVSQLPPERATEVVRSLVTICIERYYASA